MKKTVYISLPISGYPLEECRQRAAKVEAQLREQGFNVINPFYNGLPATAPVEAHYKADLKEMLFADSILFLDGWENSVGCNLERHVASHCDIPFAFAGENDEVTPYIVKSLNQE